MVEVDENEAIDASSEPRSNPLAEFFSNRMVQIFAGVGVALIIVLIAVGFVVRGSGGQKTKSTQVETNYNESKKYKYEPVFEKLTPVDASQIREALGFERIPFKSVKEGRDTNISVRKEFADEARIKMSQLGLPEGGVVGFEIFDKAQSLGATDFDKRIQYVRAVSGELSRTISHMQGIAAARVQIVIPEQKSFGDRVPGSASVILVLKNGGTISDKQVKGIMHLIASSVEDVAPENVTIVDNKGAILSDRIKAAMLNGANVGLVDMLSTEGDDKRSPLELMIRFRDQLLKNYELSYTNKVKQVMATLFPMGSYLVFVNVDLKESEKEAAPYSLSKIDVAILIDEKNPTIKLTTELKNSTFMLVASTIGYKEGRDSIVIEKGPFVNIDSEKESVKGISSLFNPVKAVQGKKTTKPYIFKFVYVFVLVTLIFIFIILRYYNSPTKEDVVESEFTDEAIEDIPEVQVEGEDLAKEKFQLYLQNNEDKVLSKIKDWLANEL